MDKILLTPISKVEIISLLIRKLRLREISSLPKLYNQSVMETGSESRFVQSQTLIMAQSRVSPSPIVPRYETIAKAQQDNDVKRWSLLQSDRGARPVNNESDYRAHSEKGYDAMANKMHCYLREAFHQDRHVRIRCLGSGATQSSCEQKCQDYYFTRKIVKVMFKGRIQLSFYEIRLLVFSRKLSPFSR